MKHLKPAGHSVLSRMRRPLMAAFAALVACAFSAEASEKNAIESLTYQQSQRTETVTITMRRPAQYKARVLERNERHSRPFRLFIDLHNTGLQDAAVAPALPETSIIQRIRTARHNPTTTRVVFDLKTPVQQDQFTLQQLDGPPRIVVTFAPGRKTAAAPRPAEPAAAPAQPAPDPPPAALEASRPPAPPPAEATRAPAPYIIVIDPGHGGRDPGAIGFRGIKEKDVALAISRELHGHINSLPGYKAILTRSSDISLSLDERAAIANASNADIFISVHANSHTDTQLTGIETYYLNFSSDATARKVAARENFTTPAQVSDLEMILFDLMQSGKINTSSILAGFVHNALVAEISCAYRDFRNLGVKHAPMRVLIDAEMPCILIEAAFISNPEEARRLQNPRYQKLLARAIAEGAERFKNGHRTALYATGN